MPSLCDIISIFWVLSCYIHLCGLIPWLVILTICIWLRGVLPLFYRPRSVPCLPKPNFSRAPDTSGENNKVAIVALFYLPEYEFTLVQGLLISMLPNV